MKSTSGTLILTTNHIGIHENVILINQCSDVNLLPLHHGVIKRISVGKKLFV